MGGQTKPKPFGISRDKILTQGLIGLLKIKYFLPNFGRVSMGAQQKPRNYEGGDETTTFGISKYTMCIQGWNGFYR